VSVGSETIISLPRSFLALRRVPMRIEIGAGVLAVLPFVDAGKSNHAGLVERI
jgi:hypothetical protein